MFQLLIAGPSVLELEVVTSLENIADEAFPALFFFGGVERDFRRLKSKSRHCCAAEHLPYVEQMKVREPFFQGIAVKLIFVGMEEN